MSNRWLGSTDVPRGDVYDARFTALAQSGHDVHGEAHFVTTLGALQYLMPDVVQAEWRSSWHAVVSTWPGSISTLPCSPWHVAKPRISHGMKAISRP